MIGLIIAGIIGFIAGFALAASTKDSINIGFGNKNTTTITYKDGEQKIKADKK